MKGIIRICILVTLSGYLAQVHGQVYFTKDGKISFDSETPLEKIEAVNEKAVSILNIAEEKIEFSVLIKGFLFPNALMQTHFNENYMISNQYPKAIFKSTEVDFSMVDFKQDGIYKVPVKGVLNIRDIDKEIESEAVITVSGDDVNGTASFTVSPTDFDIDIPNLVKEKIAKEIHVSIDAEYQIYEKK